MLLESIWESSTPLGMDYVSICLGFAFPQSLLFGHFYNPRGMQHPSRHLLLKFNNRESRKNE